MSSLQTLSVIEGNLAQLKWRGAHDIWSSESPNKINMLADEQVLKELKPLLSLWNAFPVIVLRSFNNVSVVMQEVKCLVGGTSEKFIPEPMGEDITADLINGLRRFKDAARWKVYFELLQEEKDKENQSNGNIAATHKKKNKNNNHTTLGWKPILNLSRLTYQPLEQMTKPRDSSYNLKRNFLNKHLIKLKPKDATTDPTKSRA